MTKLKGEKEETLPPWSGRAGLPLGKLAFEG
jgi:hypothetical protein